MRDLMSNIETKSEKIKLISAEIIKRLTPNGKYYYEIKYRKLDDKIYHIGYGSYNLDYVEKWIDKCFDIATDNKNMTKGDRING